ncbi:MAG: hypothetical protein ACOVMJ_08655 [Flavobacteriales bacterium]
MKKKMKNNEWNIPSDYFEKNKKALMPVRNFPNGKWLLVLAAACAIGVGFFMWKGIDQNQEIAQEQTEEGKRGEEEGREGKNGEENVREDKKGEEKVREGKIENESLVKRGEEKVREGKSKEEVAQGLKEISREELVAYLLEEDTDFIENIN